MINIRSCQCFAFMTFYLCPGRDHVSHDFDNIPTISYFTVTIWIFLIWDLPMRLPPGLHLVHLADTWIFFERAAWKCWDGLSTSGNSDDMSVKLVDNIYKRGKDHTLNIIEHSPIYQILKFLESSFLLKAMSHSDILPLSVPTERGEQTKFSCR